MSAIVRGEGVTESERYLAALADKAFLRLWSYPNVFVDKKDGKNPKNKQGKEFADLFVVCGDDILVFSDKSIEWPDSELPLAWSRWYRRAIAHSVDQLRGAERWLNDFPDRLYLDRECTRPFPFALPPPDRRRVHLIAVAVGASKACVEFFDGGIGTLVIEPAIAGTQHHDAAPDRPVKPFCIGDVNPEGTFVHTFDPEALDIVLSELDTITDFTTYLSKRAAFIRSKILVAAQGEEDLVALFMKAIGPDGSHDFVRDNGTAWRPEDRVAVDPGTFEWLLRQPGYQGKKAADRVSYVWDRLIEQFAGHVMDGTSTQVLPEQDLSVAMSERALRVMARENRLNRRVLGGSINDALLSAERLKAPRFARRILPGPDAVNQTTGYIFLILAYPEIELAGGYDQYRRTRTTMLEAYCYDLSEQYPALEVIIGIAVDASPEVTGRNGGSEDLALLERPEWTPELLAMLQERRELYGMRKTSELEMRRMQDDEYPDARPADAPSRQQRRAAERALRKARRLR